MMVRSFQSVRLDSSSSIFPALLNLPYVDRLPLGMTTDGLCHLPTLGNLVCLGGLIHHHPECLSWPACATNHPHQIGNSNHPNFNNQNPCLVISHNIFLSQRFNNIKHISMCCPIAFAPVISQEIHDAESPWLSIPCVHFIDSAVSDLGIVTPYDSFHGVKQCSSEFVYVWSLDMW